MLNNANANTAELTALKLAVVDICSTLATLLQSVEAIRSRVECLEAATEDRPLSDSVAKLKAMRAQVDRMHDTVLTAVKP